MTSMTTSLNDDKNYICHFFIKTYFIFQYSIYTKFHVKWTKIFWDTGCFFTTSLIAPTPLVLRFSKKPSPGGVKDPSAFNHSSSWLYLHKLCLGHSDFKSELMILMFPPLKVKFLSHGSNGMTTTSARWHCACTKITDEISLLTISSWESWSTLFVLQRIKIQDKVEFKANFIFFILHNKFLILSPGIPKFKVLCLEKYSDQISWYLLMFDIRESPTNYWKQII